MNLLLFSLILLMNLFMTFLYFLNFDHEFSHEEILNYKLSATININLRQLANGVYIIEVAAKDKVWRKKLVKE